MGEAPWQKHEWSPLPPQAGGSPQQPRCLGTGWGWRPHALPGSWLCGVGAEGFREQMLPHEPSWGWGSPGRDERCWGRC